MWALPEYTPSLSISSLSPIQLLNRTLSDGARQLVSQLKLHSVPPQASLNLSYLALIYWPVLSFGVFNLLLIELSVDMTNILPSLKGQQTNTHKCL